MRRQGRIVEWNVERGFGFVLWHGGDERAFAHISEFSGHGIRPAVGDVVTYELACDERGRVRARAIRGAHDRGQGSARSSRPAEPGASRRNRMVGALLFAALLVAAGWTYRDQQVQAAAARAAASETVVQPSRRAAEAALANPAWGSPAASRNVHAEVAPNGASLRRAPAAATSDSFQCAGKQHCSQMSSCAEAEYYLAHCPDTKMDGDGDGEPCENMCG